MHIEAIFYLAFIESGIRVESLRRFYSEEGDVRGLFGSKNFGKPSVLMKFWVQALIFTVFSFAIATKSTRLIIIAQQV